MASSQLTYPVAFSRRRPIIRARDLGWLLMALSVMAACIMVMIFWAQSASANRVQPVMKVIIVHNGDTLWSLASKYGDPHQYILERVDALEKANGLKQGAVLRAGLALNVPVANPSLKLYYGGKICKLTDEQPSRSEF